MAADAWAFYDTFPEYMGDNTIDMDADTFKMALFTSTSNAATTTNNEYGDLTNELANGNGYTTGGVTLTTVTWNNVTGTVTFDSDDAQWTASGGSLVFRFGVIYKSGTVGGVVDPLVCYTTFDNTPADITVSSGNSFTAQINASGIFTLS